MSGDREGMLAEGLRAAAEPVELEKRSAGDIEREAAAIQDAAVRSQERDDNAALSLVGAVIGDFFVKDRVRPGKRWRYVAHNTRTGKDHYLRGYELVREVNATVRNGGVVIMPNEPWRQEK